MAGTEPDPARRKMENNVQQHARAGGMKVYHHKHVPQWLRLALRISIGVVLLSLPILASREPALDLKPKLANFSSIFVVRTTARFCMSRAVAGTSLGSVCNGTGAAAVDPLCGRPHPLLHLGAAM